MEFQGIDRLSATFKAIPEQCNRATRRGVGLSARTMKMAARAKAPVGPTGPRAEGGQDRHPGKLRRTISYTPVRQVGTWAWQTYLRTRAPYAPKIERKEPFFRPAFNETAGVMREIHAKVWGDAIRNINK